MAEIYDQFGEDWFDTFTDIQETMREEYGVDPTDDYGQDLLFAGWFDAELSPEEREEARETFFDYFDLEPVDFDWDTWREAYA